MRVRKGSAKTQKHKKVLKAVRGYIGAGSRKYRIAKQVLLKSGRYATYGRALRKRDMRSMWIARINAACRMRGMTYSRFIEGLAKLQIAINRKMLSEVAIADPAAFDKLVSMVSGQAVAPTTATPKRVVAKVRKVKPAAAPAAEA